MTSDRKRADVRTAFWCFAAHTAVHVFPGRSAYSGPDTRHAPSL